MKRLRDVPVSIVHVGLHPDSGRDRWRDLCNRHRAKRAWQGPLLPIAGQICVTGRHTHSGKVLTAVLAALCDTSIGAVNRRPEADVRQFINRLCGGEDDEIPVRRITEHHRTLDQLRSPGS